MVMIQRVSVIGIVFAATLWGAVFTPAPPFNVKDAGGQILPACPVGYERNELGTCVPIVDPDPDGGSGDETAIEQEIGQKNVCSGWAVCTNDAANREESAIGDDAP